MSRVRIYVYLTLLPAVLITGQGVEGQCILANPSFELGGSGGDVFGGWNQFGVVGSSTDATHGAVAAKLTGPDWGGWDVSGYWQAMDTSPGERWSASVQGWHTSINPLTGGSKAILNIEWRDSGGGLISFESHTVADASTPVDEIQDFYVESGPAPSGTVKTRILLGVLQSPTEPPPDVYYDLATFYNMGPPTMDDMQWYDFPGGRTIDFSDRTWRVKGPGYYGPGPNHFCDDPGCTWVDMDDRLHVTVQNIGGTWYSTEVVLEEALGYGDYIFTTVGRIDNIDPYVVLGLFLWQYGPCWHPSYLWWNPFNEIDIEFSRWGDLGNDVAQFVAQPYDYLGNIERFDVTLSEGELSSHAFRWLHDRVEYRSWRGGPDEEMPANMIHAWTYTGPHIPRPEQPRVHINFWKFNGPPDSNQEVIIDEFTFIPEGGVSAIPEDVPASRTGYLSAAWPNPFNPHTTITYTIPKGGNTEITVYDALGRHVRTLVSGFVPAGEHDVVWNGRNDSGDAVSSGVYLYRLRTDGIVETRKMVLLK